MAAGDFEGLESLTTLYVVSVVHGDCSRAKAVVSFSNLRKTPTHIWALFQTGPRRRSAFRPARLCKQRSLHKLPVRGLSCFFRSPQHGQCSCVWGGQHPKLKGGSRSIVRTIRTRVSSEPPVPQKIKRLASSGNLAKYSRSSEGGHAPSKRSVFSPTPAVPLVFPRPSACFQNLELQPARGASVRSVQGAGQLDGSVSVRMGGRHI